MDLLEQVEERLSVFKNLYDIIRVVDPVKKKNIIVINDKEEQSVKCYAVWKKEVFCENCISMRAYINNDTFVKIEYDKEKIVLLIATPVEIDGKAVIVEILKDITKNASLSHEFTENSELIQELVSSINKTSELLSMADKSQYEAKIGGSNMAIINEQKVKGTRITSINSKSMKLSRLNEEINELREVLNEVCCTLDSDETYNDRLLLSQQLDELIVQYMKEMNNIK